LFGGYELLELIGEGGMGVVYRARQIGLDREVAVKLLAAGPWASTEFIERFRREAQNAARMQHPNIVAIYEVGDAEELQFFSMRLVRGDSLAAVLRREGKLPAMRAAQLLRTIAETGERAAGRNRNATRRRLRPRPPARPGAGRREQRSVGDAELHGA
jgi:serine/threonine protein kinase